MCIFFVAHHTIYYASFICALILSHGFNIYYAFILLLKLVTTTVAAVTPDTLSDEIEVSKKQAK